METDNMKSMLSLPETPKHVVCQYCHAVFRPGNHQVAVVPRMKVNKKVVHLQQKAASGVTLGKFHQMLVDMCSARNNRLIITCHTCKHRTTVAGCSRSEMKLILQHSQPTPPPVMNLSKSQKRKQKRKQKAQRSSQNDSGLDLSHLSVDSAASLRDPGKAGLPKATSTPLLSRSRRKIVPPPLSDFSSSTTLNHHVSLLDGSTCSSTPSKSSQRNNIESATRTSSSESITRTSPGGSLRTVQTPENCSTLNSQQNTSARSVQTPGSSSSLDSQYNTSARNIQTPRRHSNSNSQNNTSARINPTNSRVTPGGGASRVIKNSLNSGNATKLAASSPIKRGRKGSRHNMLQKMLAKEKLTQQQNSGNASSLMQFLSTV